MGSRTNNAVSSSTGQAVPPIRIEEGIREYADASTSTDPIEPEPVPIAGPSTTHEHPPAYTAEPPPLNEKQILDRAHPRQEGHGIDVDVEYEALVDALGMRCTVLEDEMEQRKAERVKKLSGEFLCR